MYSLGLGSVLFPSTTPAQVAAYCSADRWNWLTSVDCWGRSLEDWQRGALATVAAAPGAPPVGVWTVAPADGSVAQTTVDEILAGQLREQQRLNAAGVDSSIAWRAASGIEAAGDAAAGAAAAVGNAVAGAIDWKLWALLGVGAVAVFVAVGGGSPRRYGR